MTTGTGRGDSGVCERQPAIVGDRTWHLTNMTDQRAPPVVCGALADKGTLVRVLGLMDDKAFEEWQANVQMASGKIQENKQEDTCRQIFACRRGRRRCRRRCRAQCKCKPAQRPKMDDDGVGATRD